MAERKWRIKVFDGWYPQTLLVLLVAPTGWLYDLWAGEGTEQAGVHTHQNSGVKRSVNISEYIYADYPLSPLQRFIQRLVGGYYNRYYLTELEDGSWLCVYFDDYLTLTGADHYPTGYVRYTTTEERRMLNKMAEDYDVDSVYVLDMYQHGKVSWMIDVLLRLAVCLTAAGIMWSVKKAISKHNFPIEGE